jgi:hypothetical protein
VVQNLYNINVRKVVVMGLAPIGCSPHYLWQYSSKNGECIDSINNVVREFNFLMRFMIEELGEELPDSNIIFCDVFEGSMDIIKNHRLYGEKSSEFFSYFTKTLIFAYPSYPIYCALVQVSMLLLMLAVGWESTGVGSCVYHQIWLAVMLPIISGGISSTQPLR